MPKKPTSPPAPIHPGLHVRATVLAPRKLTVVAAAKLLDIGRPALTNFLNGKAATTPKMAARLAGAFGVSATEVLEMQAAYDAAGAGGTAPANVKSYVAPFLQIKAVEVERWADRNISARTRLAVLLRTLVNSAGIAHTKVDFPGNDDAQRPGWDGYVDSPKATAWIPAGRSGWEFGTNEKVTEKADHDFAKSVAATPKAEREKTTFLFVSPRHWPQKASWLKKVQAKALWKDVRAYDSSDLEQWLEQSLPAQAWFANETDRASSQVRSLDKAWAYWASATTPPLAGSLFGPAVESAKAGMLSRLQKRPDAPIVIAADSVGEALAFLSQLFGPMGGPELEVYRDRVLIFDKPGVLPELARGNTDFIPVTGNREVERELGPNANSMHAIVVYPRNATNVVTPDILLEPLDARTFGEALAEMGLRGDEITRHSGASGRSLTVLRRQLTKVPAIKTPAWAIDRDTARRLIPYLFIGAWERANKADQTVLSLLAQDVPYEELEQRCQDLAALEDAPLWSVGGYHGVVSKIDLLFSISASLTPKDLQRFFDVAELVLGEDDPRLDLPEEDRWAAGMYGKTREVSTTVREGLADTLVLLAVHGNTRVLERTGFNCEHAAWRLVGNLLTPLTARGLEAQSRDLPAYAEAAPDRFLAILEDDLRYAQPETYGLLRPAGSAIFGSCPRTGLLWGLETLAWSSTTLPRVALILAQLAQIEIEDNWVNKPIHSLESIFRAWMPQTGADLATRVSAVQLVAQRFPNTAWRLCMSQLERGSSSGTYNHKPTWRHDADGHGEPVGTYGPVRAFQRKLLDMVLAWPDGYTREMVCDLVDRLPGFPDADQTQAWGLVHKWAQERASDADKAVVRESIRRSILTRRGKRRAGTKATQVSAAASKARTALLPADVLNRHEWLFRQPWVDWSADEMTDEDFSDYQKRDELIAASRADALRAIIADRGLQAVVELAEMGKASSVIGHLLVTHGLVPDADLAAFLLTVLPQDLADPSWARKELAGGMLHFLDADVRERVLDAVAERMDEAGYARLLLRAPFRRRTWMRVSALADDAQRMYWQDVSPDWHSFEDDDERNEAVELLLRAERPHAAFASMRYDMKSIKPELLYRVMSELPKTNNDAPDPRRVEGHDIESAFVLLNKHGAFSVDQLAMLEFFYIDALSQPWSEREGYGLPNMGKYVEQHPELFVQAIAWTYRRKDGIDPPEWRVSTEQVSLFAERGHKLLEGLDRIPGHNEVGELDAEVLADWIRSVREACAELGRLDVADIAIGKLLSEAPAGKDGIWPCEPVRHVMEELHSRNIMRGAHTGLYNSRGAFWRGEGGDQERHLAATYRGWANALQYTHPFVAELLAGMADTYEHEASREDTDVRVRRRLRGW
jgi:addiction module HigA family antidote